MKMSHHLQTNIKTRDAFLTGHSIKPQQLNLIAKSLTQRGNRFPAAHGIRMPLEKTVFGRLGSEALDDIASQARFEHYEKPMMLQAAGTLPTTLRLVIKGHIKLLTGTLIGKEVCLSQIGPGAWATWMPCLIPAVTSYDLCSAADSVYIAISAQSLRNFCENHPEIYPLILAEINKRMELLITWAGQASLMPHLQRLAVLIHLLACDQKITAYNGILNVNQTRLADLSGHSRQSVNHLLGELENKGLLMIKYGGLMIPSLKRLSAFAEIDNNSAE